MKYKYDKLIVYLIGYIYTLIMVILTSGILYVDIPFITLLLMVAVIYPIITLLMSFRISRLVAFLLLGMAAITTGFLYITGYGGFITDQIKNIGETYKRIYYQETIPIEDMKTATFIIVILAAILLSVLVYFLFNRFFRFFLITAAIFTMHLLVWYYTGSENRALLAVTCLLTVISYFRHIYEKKIKSGLITDHKVPGSLMLFSIPAVIIPVMIVMGMPKSDFPIQWPWLDHKVMSVMQYLEERFSRTDMEFFSLSATGFSDSSRLGGPVRPNHTIIMDVKGYRRTYLRGAVYSRYEKNMWYQDINEEAEANEMENTLLENRMGWRYIPVDALFPEIEGDDADLLKNLASGIANPFLFPTQSLEIKYRNMTTRTVFTPLLTIMPITGTQGNLSVVQNEYGIANHPSKLPTGSQYTVYYAQPMYGAPMLKRALMFSSNTLYSDALKELMKQRDNLGPNPSPDNPYLESLNRGISMVEQLLERSREIEKQYTFLSENIPERVGQLAEIITDKCNNEYEKVVAIEDYLRKNFEYTLNASRVPEGHDFVDWFLFEDKRGYCTYYSTAMTIMLRHLGIPARYVEGFVMPDQHRNHLYTVTSRHAHAWVEVYFQGFGWLTFEPTPVYADVMQYVPASENLDSSQLSPEDLQELMERYSKMYGNNDYQIQVSGESSPLNIKPYLKYIPLVIAGLIMAMAIVNLLVILFDNIILLGMNRKKRVIRFFQIMLVWLEHSGYTINPGESVREFGRRVDKYFIFSASSFTDASDIFYRVRYGDKSVTQDELLIIQDIAKQLKKSLLKDLGIRRFMPLRRIVYRI